MVARALQPVAQELAMTPSLATLSGATTRPHQTNTASSHAGSTQTGSHPSTHAPAFGKALGRAMASHASTRTGSASSSPDVGTSPASSSPPTGATAQPAGQQRAQQPAGQAQETNVPTRADAEVTGGVLADGTGTSASVPAHASGVGPASGKAAAGSTDGRKDAGNSDGDPQDIPVSADQPGPGVPVPPPAEGETQAPASSAGHAGSDSNDVSAGKDAGASMSAASYVGAEAPPLAGAASAHTHGGDATVDGTAPAGAGATDQPDLPSPGADPALLASGFQQALDASGNGSRLEAPPTAASGTTSATPASASTQEAETSPVLLGVQTTPDGGSQIALSLRPDSMGAVDIRVERSASGPTVVVVAAAEPQTLRALMHHQADLHDALDAGGLPHDGRHVRFELSDGAGSSPASDTGGPPTQAAASAGEFERSDDRSTATGGAGGGTAGSGEEGQKGRHDGPDTPQGYAATDTAAPTGWTSSFPSPAMRIRAGLNITA